MVTNPRNTSIVLMVLLQCVSLASLAHSAVVVDVAMSFHESDAYNVVLVEIPVSCIESSDIGRLVIEGIFSSSCEASSSNVVVSACPMPVDEEILLNVIDSATINDFTSRSIIVEESTRATLDVTSIVRDVGVDCELGVIGVIIGSFDTTLDCIAVPIGMDSEGGWRAMVIYSNGE